MEVTALVQRTRSGWGELTSNGERAVELKARCDCGEWDDEEELPVVLLCSDVFDRSHRTTSERWETGRERSAECFLQELGCSSVHPFELL